MSSAGRVLAIGLDAAESTLVDRLVAEGDMPALASLMQRGRRLTVGSTATIGSGCVWPTFYTAAAPAEHGIHSGWAWDPRSMRLHEVTSDHLRPFWRDMEEEGISVGVFDVPYAPSSPPPQTRGFEVHDWGSHDTWLPSSVVFPKRLAVVVDIDHPFSRPDVAPIAPDDLVAAEVVVDSCLSGARLKGELARKLMERERTDLTLVVFGEVHRSGHALWHTFSGDHAVHADIPAEQRDVSPGLLDIYRELDRQIGLLVDDAGDDSAVVVFSLHGFRPGRGVVGLLDPVLHALGYSHDVRASRPTARTVFRAALAAVKRRTPLAVKRVYHRRIPRAARFRLAGPTMMPALDWKRTRAFALPSDQHGWVRVNLRGREAEGIVPVDDYEPLLDELEHELARLTDEEGRPLVKGLMRPAPDGAPELLPDLVVHWTEAAFAAPVRVAGLDVEATPIARRITGQHRAEGFCVAVGVEVPGDRIETADLHRILRPAARS